MVVVSILVMHAQNVMVSVVPVQQVLPPQALTYIDNPGKFFNITLTNVSSETQNVYLSINVDCAYPVTQSMFSTPNNIQPSQPISIGPNRTIQLNMVDMKRLFSHLSSRNIHVAPSLLSGYGGGSFGLLPEGRYQLTVTAYKWSNPPLASPVAVSNPSSGGTMFTVSYKAKAPEMLLPLITSVTDGYAELDPVNALFTWKESIVTSSVMNVRYSYSLRIVEVLPGQPVDYAMDNNPSVYRISNLISPTCVIPLNYVQNRMSPEKLYAAQVTAVSKTLGALDYVLVDNNGKSDIRLFKIVPVLRKAVEPQDTLRDEFLMEFTEGIEEIEDDEYTAEEYELKIEDCLVSALDMEEKTRQCDFNAKCKLQEIQTTIASMRKMTYAAAKKAGLTDRVKDAYKAIVELQNEAEQASDQAALDYKNAYVALQKLEKQRHKTSGSLDGADTKSMYDICVTAIGKAKTAAKNAQVYFSNIQSTEFVAQKNMKYLRK